jgi:chromosome segregation ATPase
MLTALVLGILGAVGIFGAVSAGASAHKEAMRAQSEAEANASVAELQAQKYESQQETVLENIESVEAMIDQLERQKKQVIKKLGKAGERVSGEQSLLFAASGLETTGTPLEIMRETARNLEGDIYQVRENYKTRHTVMTNKIETLRDTYEQLGYAAEAARTQAGYYEETAMSIDPQFEAFNAWFSGLAETGMDVLSAGLTSGLI